jgi:hypothetical protein
MRIKPGDLFAYPIRVAYVIAIHTRKVLTSRKSRELIQTVHDSQVAMLVKEPDPGILKLPD